jgi:hypothetical protein
MFIPTRGCAFTLKKAISVPLGVTPPDQLVVVSHAPLVVPVQVRVVCPKLCFPANIPKVSRKIKDKKTDFVANVFVMVFALLVLGVQTCINKRFGNLFYYFISTVLL